MTHIDNNAIVALTKYYGREIDSIATPSILDLCGSWISHLPLPLPPNSKVYGLGLNAEELAKNEAYTHWKVYDLNKSEKQEWDWIENGTLDLVICTVSIDYLIYPVSVLEECRQKLKDGIDSLL